MSQSSFAIPGSSSGALCPHTQGPHIQGPSASWWHSHLAMNKISVHEGTLQHADHRISIICRLRTNIFKHECQHLETPHMHIQFGCLVLVENCRDTGKCQKITISLDCWDSKVKNLHPQVSATMVIETILQTRLWHSCMHRFVRRTKRMSQGPKLFTEWVDSSMLNVILVCFK